MSLLISDGGKTVCVECGLGGDECMCIDLDDSELLVFVDEIPAGDRAMMDEVECDELMSQDGAWPTWPVVEE